MRPRSQGLSLPRSGEKDPGTRLTVMKSEKKIALLDDFPKLITALFINTL